MTLKSVLHTRSLPGAQEEVFRRREEGLKKKDLELQASLIRFSKFLQARSMGGGGGGGGGTAICMPHMHASERMLKAHQHEPN